MATITRKAKSTSTPKQQKRKWCRIGTALDARATTAQSRCVDGHPSARQITCWAAMLEKLAGCALQMQNMAWHLKDDPDGFANLERRIFGNRARLRHFDFDRLQTDRAYARAKSAELHRAARAVNSLHNDMERLYTELSWVSIVLGE